MVKSCLINNPLHIPTQSFPPKESISAQQKVRYDTALLIYDNPPMSPRGPQARCQELTVNTQHLSAILWPDCGTRVMRYDRTLLPTMPINSLECGIITHDSHQISNVTSLPSFPFFYSMSYRINLPSSAEVVSLGSIYSLHKT